METPREGGGRGEIGTLASHVFLHALRLLVYCFRTERFYLGTDCRSLLPVHCAAGCEKLEGRLHTLCPLPSILFAFLFRIAAKGLPEEEKQQQQQEQQRLPGALQRPVQQQQQDEEKEGKKKDEKEQERQEDGQRFSTDTRNYGSPSFLRVFLAAEPVVAAAVTQPAAAVAVLVQRVVSPAVAARKRDWPDGETSLAVRFAALGERKGQQGERCPTARHALPAVAAALAAAAAAVFSPAAVPVPAVAQPSPSALPFPGPAPRFASFPLSVSPAEPDSAAAAATLAASSSKALQRTRQLDLLQAASPSGAITLSPEMYTSVFLSSLPPPLPPFAPGHPRGSTDGSAGEEEAARRKRRWRRRLLYLANWRRGPTRPFHMFVLFTFLLPDDLQLRTPFPQCPECIDSYQALHNIAQAYKKAEVANVALLNHAPAFHGLRSLPALVYVPPAQQQNEKLHLLLQTKKEKQQQKKRRHGVQKKKKQQQEEEHNQALFLLETKRGREEEEGEEDEMEEEDEVDVFGKEHTVQSIDPVKRMEEAAPSPFPRSELLMLQRATADAGIERAILEWVNMKTKRAVGLPSSVWTDSRSLCVLLALLLVLLLLARVLVSLMPRYPWLLPAAACAFYWLSTSGLVFSLYNRVPLYGYDMHAHKRIFISPGRSQFFVEGFLMSGCSLLVAAAGAVFISLPCCLRFSSRKGAAAAFHRKRALQAVYNFFQCSTSSSNSGNSSRKERVGGHNASVATMQSAMNKNRSNSRGSSSTSSCSPCIFAGERGDLQSILRRRYTDASGQNNDTEAGISSCFPRRDVSGASEGESGGGTATTGRGESDSSNGVRRDEREDTAGHSSETGFDVLLLKALRAAEREHRVRTRSGTDTSEQLCLMLLMVIASAIFIAAASTELQAFRYKSPWYRASFFPAAEYLRGPMRIDRGNAF